jgi:hypothetical protein
MLGRSRLEKRSAGIGTNSPNGQTCKDLGGNALKAVGADGDLGAGQSRANLVLGFNASRNRTSGRR